MLRAAPLRPHWNNHLALLIIVAGAIALYLAFFLSGDLTHVTSTHSTYSSRITPADFQAFSARFRDPTLRYFFGS